MPALFAPPCRRSYDVVIIGGAMMGASTAWLLTDRPGFDGSVLVVERDPDYESCSTAHTNSCMRQQFSNALDVRISQFAAGFVKNLRARMGGDPDVPDLAIRSFGYLYLAATASGAQALRDDHAVQIAAGAGTRLMTPNEIAAAYPFYALDDIVLGSHNPVDEGYWDGMAVFDAWRRQARARGVEFAANEVTGLTRNRAGTRIESVTLATGEAIACGAVVNATGPRAAATARMARLDLPVEPRKRHTYIFTAETPLDRDLPPTADPSGIHVRENGGGSYMCSGHPERDPAVTPDDFVGDL